MECYQVEFNKGVMMRTKLILALLMVMSISLSSLAVASTSSSVINKSSAKVQMLIDKYKLQIVDYKYVKKAIGNGTRKGAKSLLIDARPNIKYLKGTIPSSINIPDTKFEEYYKQIAMMNKSKEVIIFCGGWKCGKSPKVAGMLQKKGFKNVKLYQAGYPQWSKKTYSEVDTIVVQSAQKKNNGVLIDARPYKKYLQATIPGSISIPDTSMDKLLGKFPVDKNIKIITFCGGYGCEKSHIVARKLLSLGYKNVFVYAGGVPKWKKDGLATTGASTEKMNVEVSKKMARSSGEIKKGIDEGTIAGEWFKELLLMNKLPSSIQIVDVTPAEDFANGHLPNAMNIHAGSLDAKVLYDKLPKNKTIVFNCTSGARALEAWTKLQENKFDVSNIFYFDANIDCNKEMKCKIEVNEPLG